MSMVINPFGLGLSTGPSSGGLVTWNPADVHADIILKSSSLVAEKGTAADALRSVRASFGRAHTDNGYFEVGLALFGPGTTTAHFRLVGVSTSSLSLATYCGADTNSWGYYEDTGEKYTNSVGAALGATYTDADTVGVAFKNGKVWFSKNNVWQGGGNPAAGTGEAFSGLTGTLFPTASLYKGAAVPKHQAIFRGGSINCVYAPPTGFLYWER